MSSICNNLYLVFLLSCLVCIMHGSCSSTRLLQICLHCVLLTDSVPEVESGLMQSAQHNFSCSSPYISGQRRRLCYFHPAEELSTHQRVSPSISAHFSGDSEDFFEKEMMNISPLKLQNYLLFGVHALWWSFVEFCVAGSINTFLILLMYQKHGRMLMCYRS